MLSLAPRGDLEVVLVSSCSCLVCFSLTMWLFSFFYCFNFFPPFAADISLSQKLKEELKYEKETLGTRNTTPEFLKTFLEKGIWTVRTPFFLFVIPFSCVP